MPLGTNFAQWLKEKGKEPLSPELEDALNDVGLKMYAERHDISRQIAHGMADLLCQEYKVHDGQWWLWTLGKPARPLTDIEITEHELGAIQG